MLTAREIEVLLRDKGTERGVIHVLTVLAEQQRATHNRLMELAQMVSRITDTMVADAQVRGKMIREIGALQRNASNDVEGEDADVPQGLLRQ